MMMKSKQFQLIMKIMIISVMLLKIKKAKIKLNKMFCATN